MSRNAPKSPPCSLNLRRAVWELANLWKVDLLMGEACEEALDRLCFEAVSLQAQYSNWLENHPHPADMKYGQAVAEEALDDFLEWYLYDDIPETIAEFLNTASVAMAYSEKEWLTGSEKEYIVWEKQRKKNFSNELRRTWL